jgi:Rrf2 family iron-sulfur cluster assembly transcriptional regulator
MRRGRPDDGPVRPGTPGRAAAGREPGRTHRLGYPAAMRLELTRAGDYAVRAMLLLAEADATAWVSAARISAAMAIPPRFLPRVMRGLLQAQLVEARTGRSGGYRLARPAATISLQDVIVALEPADDARRCVLRGIPCASDGQCAVHDSFTDARLAMTDRLAATTLASLRRPTA